MDWALTEEEARSGEEGVRSLLRRFQGQSSSLDSALEGSTFLSDGQEMLRISRVFENRLLASDASGTLYVGFQNALKLEHEVERYRAIRQAGVQVFAFGEAAPDPAPAGAVDAWYGLPRDLHRLENQWYLVMRRPEPYAFVGWEVSDEPLWGEHGVTYPGKRFVGFVSEDPRLVMGISGHLDSVRASNPPPAPSSSSSSLRDTLAAIQPQRVGMLVDDGKRSHVTRILDDFCGATAIPGCDLYLYDLAAASYLLDPYPHAEDRDPFDATYARTAVRRKYLADQMERIPADGQVRGILPTGVGFSDLASWSQRLDLDALVIPAEYESPGLMDQVRGYSISALRKGTRAAIVVSDSSGSARVLRPAA